jgi:DNA-binding response OmpR family regulator
VENKKKILIVEDDMFIRDIYQVKFTQEGFEVVVAENGILALEKMKDFSPDVILLDVMMPYMNGMETLREIKAQDDLKHIPIILLTNISEKENMEEGQKLGVDSYLIKANFTPSEVVSKVRTLLKI